MAKKINTRKKGVVNIDELKAYRVAYGKELYRDYTTYIGILLSSSVVSHSCCCITYG